MPVAPPIARSVTADSPPASSSCIAEARKRSLVDIIASPARRMRLSLPAGATPAPPKLGSDQVYQRRRAIILKTAVDRREAAGFCDFARCGCIRLARAAGAPEARGH